MFLASAITGATLVLVWWGVRDEEAHIDQFGSSLAAALANQATEPLVSDDLIHLGVLANRVIELPEVIGATVYKVDGDMLALSGDVQRGRPFTREIIQDEAIVGSIRLHIDPAAFDRGTPVGTLMLSAVAILLVPVLFGLLAGPRVSMPDWRALRPSTRTAAGTGEEADEELESCYLLTLNLFNQLSLPPDQCARELEFATTVACAVAGVYRGDVESLPGTGLLITFDSQGSERSFEVICAGFVLAQLLRDADSLGNYRIGAHALWLAAGAALDGSSEDLSDAAILSALAKESCLSVSNSLFATLERKDRFHSTPLTNPLLDDLDSIGGGAQLLHSLTPIHQALVTKQVAALSHSTDHSAASTANESTF